MESKDGRNKKSSEIDSVLRKYEKQGGKKMEFSIFFFLKRFVNLIKSERFTSCIQIQKDPIYKIIYKIQFERSQR